MVEMIPFFGDDGAMKMEIEEELPLLNCHF